jgi:hypothetical protein
MAALLFLSGYQKWTAHHASGFTSQPSQLVFHMVLSDGAVEWTLTKEYWSTLDYIELSSSSLPMNCPSPWGGLSNEQRTDSYGAIELKENGTTCLQKSVSGGLSLSSVSSLLRCPPIETKDPFGWNMDQAGDVFNWHAPRITRAAPSRRLHLTASMNLGDLVVWKMEDTGDRGVRTDAMDNDEIEEVAEGLCLAKRIAEGIDVADVDKALLAGFATQMDYARDVILGLLDERRHHVSRIGELLKSSQDLEPK